MFKEGHGWYGIARECARCVFIHFTVTDDFDVSRKNRFETEFELFRIEVLGR